VGGAVSGVVGAGRPNGGIARGANRTRKRSCDRRCLSLHRASSPGYGALHPLLDVEIRREEGPENPLSLLSGEVSTRGDESDTLINELPGAIELGPQKGFVPEFAEECGKLLVRQGGNPFGFESFQKRVGHHVPWVLGSPGRSHNAFRYGFRERLEDDPHLEGGEIGRIRDVVEPIEPVGRLQASVDAIFQDPQRRLSMC